MADCKDGCSEFHLSVFLFLGRSSFIQTHKRIEERVTKFRFTTMASAVKPAGFLAPKSSQNYHLDFSLL